jgi:hypothetical protein
MKNPLLLCALALFLAALTACESQSSTPAATTPAASPSNAAAAFPKADAEQLIRRLATQDGCKDSTAELRLSFTDADGTRQQMDFRLQRKYEGGKVSTLLTVLAPKEESEKALLAFEADDKPTEGISYLAGLKKIARLKSDNPLNFRGSKSTVQEMLGIEFAKYQLVSATVAHGTITTELKGKDGMSLSYPRIVATFAEANKTPVKFELYDGRNEQLKTIHAAEVKAVQNYQAITKMEIEDHRNNLKLQLETRGLKYDTNLPTAIFTEANLIKAVTAASQKQLQ